MRRAAELNRRETGGHHWFPRETGGRDWDVVAVAAPGLRPTGELKATIVSQPKPNEPPDPRSSLFRNIPPFGPG